MKSFTFTNLFNTFKHILQTFIGVTTKPIRIIRTTSSMAHDCSVTEGVVVNSIVRKVYDGSKEGKDISFFVITMSDKTTTEVPVQDCYPSRKDGVLEYRF